MLGVSQTTNFFDGHEVSLCHWVMILTVGAIDFNWPTVIDENVSTFCAIHACHFHFLFDVIHNDLSSKMSRALLISFCSEFHLIPQINIFLNVVFQMTVIHAFDLTMTHENSNCGDEFDDLVCVSNVLFD
jgi:hypothetical protein